MDEFLIDEFLTKKNSVDGELDPLNLVQSMSSSVGDNWSNICSIHLLFRQSAEESFRSSSRLGCNFPVK